VMRGSLLMGRLLGHEDGRSAIDNHEAPL